MARTEEEKVARAPLLVKLGGKEYPIVPLVIREARAWRLKVVNVLTSLPDYINATTDTPDDFNAALKALLVTMQDTTLDLFFEYAKDLPRDEIEKTTTDEEVAEAFSRVIEIAFPLSRSLAEVRTKLFP